MYSHGKFYTVYFIFEDAHSDCAVCKTGEGIPAIYICVCSTCSWQVVIVNTSSDICSLLFSLLNTDYSLQYSVFEAFSLT